MQKQKHRATTAKQAKPVTPPAIPISPPTKVDTASMVDKRAPRMEQLLDRTLDAIEASFEATRNIVIDKSVVDGGPDHYARLTGAKRFLEFLLAGRPRPEKEQKREGVRVTLQQLEAAVRELESPEPNRNLVL